MRCSRNFKLFFAGVLMAGCSGGQQPSRDMLRYFEGEVNHRLQILKESPSVPDSVYRSAEMVHTRIGEMILLSKDVENLAASVHLSNSYLREVFSNNGLRVEDISYLSTDMHVNEVAVVLRQNELGFLNTLILNKDSTTRIFTAQ